MNAPTSVGETDRAADAAAQDLLDLRARLLAVPRDDGAVAGDPYLSLRVGDHCLGIPAARIRHVTAPGAVTAVPDAPTAIVGIVSVIGAIVPVADLATILGVPASRGARHLVVVDDGDEGLGLLVDDVDAVVALRTPQAEDDAEDHERATAGGPLAGTVVEGLRLLDLDALLADQRLTPAGTMPATPAPEVP